MVSDTIASDHLEHQKPADKGGDRGRRAKFAALLSATVRCRTFSRMYFTGYKFLYSKPDVSVEKAWKNSGKISIVL